MTIDFHNKYILNPEYFLKVDTNRIILASTRESLISTWTYIHPALAVMLSYFTGEFSLNETIKKISESSIIKESKILKLITPFIENDKQLWIEYDKTNFCFPPNILIKNNANSIRRDLKQETYLLPPPYDFETLRFSIPMGLLLVLNMKCKTDCIYCYADRTTPYLPLSVNKILDLIHEAHTMGINSIDISGGDLFTYLNWDILLKTLYDKGYEPYISTKIPLSIKEIEKLYNTGCRKIQISLDTLNPQLLKDTLKVPLDYCDKMKKTIGQLDKKGFSIVIKSVFTKSTCTLENFKQLTEFFSSIPHLHQYIYTSVGYSQYKSVEAFNNFKPSMEQIIDLIEYFDTLQRDQIHYKLRPDVGGVSDGIECHNAKIFNNRAICTGNICNIVILPDGKVTLCEELYWNPNFIIGDITKNSLKDIWHSEKAYSLWKLDQNLFPNESACHSCLDFQACRYHKGVCWKLLLAAYGKENWLYPDYRCPKAPQPKYPIFYDNSFIAGNVN